MDPTPATAIPPPEPLIYALILLVGAGLSIALAIVTVPYRRAPGGAAFLALLISVAVYALGYAMEITRRDLSAILTMSRIQYLAIPFIPTFLVLFSLEYAGYGRRKYPALTGVLLALSLTTLAIRQTTHIHGLYYGATALDPAWPFPVLSFEPGIWYWVQTIYSLAAMTFSVVLITYRLVRSPRVFRRQIAWILAGLIVPWFPFVLYQSRAIAPGIDLTPISFTIALSFFAVAIFRYSFMTLAPLARDRVIEMMDDGVLVTDGQGRVMDMNPAAARIFDLDIPSVIGLRADEVLRGLPPEQEKDGKADFNLDGRHFRVGRTPITTSNAGSGGSIVIIHDVTEREAMINRLEEMAKIDGLTGILNRMSWEAVTREELRRLVRYDHVGSLLMIDIDRFKAINDTLGHAAGDETLKGIATILKMGIREIDLLGRYGGEEFVLFLPETPPDAAAKVADRLREAIKVLKVTASIGISAGPRGKEWDLDAILQAADTALYRAKAEGRDRVVIQGPRGEENLE